MGTPSDWVIVEMCDENEPSYYELYCSDESQAESVEYEEYDDDAGAGGDCMTDDTSEDTASSQSYETEYVDESEEAGSTEDDSDCERGTDSTVNMNSGDSEEDGASDEEVTDADNNLDEFYERVTNMHIDNKNKKIESKEKNIGALKETVKSMEKAPVKVSRAVNNNKNVVETQEIAQSCVTTCKSDGRYEVLSTNKHSSTKQTHLSADKPSASKCMSRLPNGTSQRITFQVTGTADVPGDAMDAQLHGLDIDGDALNEPEALSAECSTRFDFTPAATRTDFTPGNRKSSNGDSGMRSSGAYSGSFSAASGRKNPRTKIDSEVRSTVAPISEAKLWATQLNTRVQICETARQQSCPADGHPKTTDCPGPGKPVTRVVTKPGESQMAKTSGQDNKANAQRCQCTDRKPDIPHQLRSTACYQDGKVDVSILGDQRFLASADGVNLQITLVHRSLSPNKGKPGVAKTKAETAAQGADARQPSGVRKKSAMKSVLPPIGNRGQQNPYKSPKKSAMRRLKTYDFQQIPARKMSGLERNVLPPLHTHVVNGRPMTIKQPKPSMNKETKRKRKSIKKKHGPSPQNFDVINLRAQWPPFNTYVDKEASERYQRLITGLPNI